MAETTVAGNTDRWRPSGVCSFFVCDIAQFSDARRPDSIRPRLRRALYDGLRRSFDAAGVSPDDIYQEDRGDGVMVILRATVRTEVLLTTVVQQLRAELRHHNEAANEVAQIRLRVAVNVGEAVTDDHGVVSSALVHTFRLLDCGPLREAVRTAETSLGVAVSQRVYDDVVRHGRGLVDPGDYFQAEVQVKETVDHAWITVPGARPGRTPAASAAPVVSGVPGSAVRPVRPRRPAWPGWEPVQPDGPDPGLVLQAVTDMLAIQQLLAERNRDHLVGTLSPDTAGAIGRSAEARADLYAILQTCLDYPGGLQELLTGIRVLAGASLPVRRLEETIALLIMQMRQRG